jgi:anti-sigma B factor antagonist
VEERPAAGRPDGIRVVTLPVEIDPDTAEHVHAALTRALAGGVTVLVADMAGTDYCTLEGVQALLRARRAAEAAGAQLRLAAVRPAVQRVLGLTGTSGLLRLYPTLDAARDGRAH